MYLLWPRKVEVSHKFLLMKPPYLMTLLLSINLDSVERHNCFYVSDIACSWNVSKSNQLLVLPCFVSYHVSVLHLQSILSEYSQQTLTRRPNKWGYLILVSQPPHYEINSFLLYTLQHQRFYYSKKTLYDRWRPLSHLYEKRIGSNARKSVRTQLHCTASSV